LSSSNKQLLLSIIITIILITIIHTPIPMIITTSHMITAHTKSMISISTMLVALTGILMKMKLKRKKKRKNVVMIIQPIIIIIIQRYRRETSKAITLITTLIWKVSARHSQ
jgi:glucose uptake protein GlcU